MIVNNPAFPLICPICGFALQTAVKSAVCANNHQFDFSRDGYLNLHVKHGRAPKFLGDSKEMLRARRNFLEADFYQPLLAFLLDIEPTKSSQFILEAGCGEGYYIGNLSNRLRAVNCFGVDLAKEGIRLAAKRYKDGRFLVADLNHFIPLADQTVDLLLNIFAPRNHTEFQRVMQPNGWLITIIPHPDHLASLRHPFGLLKIAPNKLEGIQAQFQHGFRHSMTHTLRFPLALPSSDLHHLLQMMPSARHQTAVWQQTLQQQAEWQTEAAFHIMMFQKRPSLE